AEDDDFHITTEKRGKRKEKRMSKNTRQDSCVPLMKRRRLAGPWSYCIFSLASFLCLNPLPALD
ncbi:MAG: hypothetical protein M1527_00705, partial [Gammaproteobacteria bacterium]|nr:hypothetical protein [Gammaproteobacteria bacterium]